MFDLLMKPELSPKEIARIKQIAGQLLAILKREKLKIAQWTEKEATRDAVIVVSMRKAALAPLVDCCAAIENLLLAAESLDIGTCWIGLVRYYFAQKDELPRLKIPAGYEPCYAVALGYKDQRPAKALPRTAAAVTYID